jgi:NTE family protein
VEPLAQTAESEYDLFTSGNRRTDRITGSASDFSLGLGRRLGSVGVARVTLGYQRLRSTPLVTSRLEGTTRDTAEYANVATILDTLDDANFPRRGYLVAAQASAIRYQSDSGAPVKTFEADGLFPLTYGRLTFLGLASASRSRDERGGFNLGGFLNLSGTPPGAVSGASTAFVGALAYYNMGTLPRGVGRNWYAGGSLEAGNAWRGINGLGTRGVRKAASVFVGIDSLIGPLYLGYGRTFGGDSALYLFLGRPTDRN